jgi:hypothetical protein
MQIVTERQLQCPAFSNVKVSHELAIARLPVDGIPEHITVCATMVPGSERTPMRLDGPASKAPEKGIVHDDGQTSSEDDTECEEGNNAAEDASFTAGAESSIAVDSVYEIKPVRQMQALKAQLDSLHRNAEKIIRNEKTARIKGKDGKLQPVPDEGGRENMQSLILDVQGTASSFDSNSLTQMESFIAQGDQRQTVCPMALAIPTGKPMDSFDARTWPACYTEWWFGDGAPNLDRQRPMLFEQCAQRLFDLEEMEYSLPTDEVQYVASSQSRFVKPEIIAVMGDVVRRMKMLRGTRAAIGRKGFDTDLKALATCTYEDFLEAMKISNPNESIVSAANRKDMPAKIRTVLQGSLLQGLAVTGMGMTVSNGYTITDF